MQNFKYLLKLIVFIKLFFPIAKVILLKTRFRVFGLRFIFLFFSKHLFISSILISFFSLIFLSFYFSLFHKRFLSGEIIFFENEFSIAKHRRYDRFHREQYKFICISAFNLICKPPAKINQSSVVASPGISVMNNRIKFEWFASGNGAFETGRHDKLSRF